MDYSSRTIALRAAQESPAGKPPRRLLARRRGAVETPKPQAPQTTVLIRRPGEEPPEPLAPERISDEIGVEGSLLWVDIRDPGAAELAMLSREFDFSPLSLEDALKLRQRPKVDEYPNYYFIVVYAPLASTGQELRMTEVDLFVGANYVVSLHPGHIPALDLARQRWERTETNLSDRVGFLAHIVVDAIIDACFPIVDDIDARLHRLDEVMFHDNRGADSAELLMLKR
ncbi:MAG: hypothetical protein LC746_18490, partial [Acidobacteria bacterium]|nr:hypothetical protein [Acidobacteriota bacterium]